MRFSTRPHLFFLIGFFALAAFPAHAAEPSLLLHFDHHYGDTSGRGFSATGILKSDGSKYPIPPLTTSRKKFGNASIEFTGSGGTAIGYILATTSAPTFGTQNFTVDFWLYPTEPSSSQFAWSNTPQRESALLYPKQMSFNFGRWGNSTNLFPEFVLVRDGAVVLRRLAFRTQNFSFSDMFTLNSFFNPSLYDYNKWNHIVITRYGEYFGVGVNGVIYWSKVSASFSVSWPDVLYLGTGGGSLYYSGFFDELRITAGESLFASKAPSKTTDPTTFASSYTVPSEPTRGIADPYLNLPNRTVTINEVSAPSEETVSSLEGAGGNATTTLSTTKRLDGTVFAEYLRFSGTDTLSHVTLYARDGTTKTAELYYDENGELSREDFFKPDGSSLMERRLYQNGKIYKEIKRRGSIEEYARYDEAGRVVYSHRFNAGSRAYEGVQTYTYDAQGRLTEHLLYYASDRYEMTRYAYDDVATLSKATYTRVPRESGKPDYFYTLQEFSAVSGTSERAIARETKTEADLSKREAIQIGQMLYGGEPRRPYRHFAYDFGKDVVADTYYDANGRKAVSYGYSISDFKPLTLRDFTYEGGVLKEERVLRFRDGFSIKPYEAHEFYSYTKTGDVDRKSVYEFSSNNNVIRSIHNELNPTTGEVRSTSIYTYPDTEDSLKTFVNLSYYNEGVLRYTASNFTGRKPGTNAWYDSAGNVISEGTFTYESPTVYRITQHLVYRGTRVLKKDERLEMPTAESTPAASDKSLATLSEDRIAEAKIGDLILQSLGVTPSSVSASNERQTLYAVARGILGPYRSKLASIGASPGKRNERYHAYSDVAVDLQNAVYAVEYRAHGATKGWNTTSQFSQEVATSWIGFDDTGEFWGFYVSPGGGAAYGSAAAAFIDMSDVSSVDRALRASSYEELAALPKRKESWDSLSTGQSTIFNTAENGRLYRWNTLAQGGAGGYLPLSELVKADPSINLILDRMLADFKKEGIDPKSLDAKSVLRKAYKYFYEKSLITYILDLSDVTQLPSETLTRGGGDCDDNAVLTLSLLYNLFLRLGEPDVAGRLGLMVGNTDTVAAVSSSNYGIGHAAVGYRDTDGTYYYLDGAPLFMGRESQKPLAETDGMLALSNGSQKTGFAKSAEWHVAMDAFSAVNGATSFFNSPITGSKRYAVAALPQPAVVNDVERFSYVSSYVQPFDSRVEALASYFSEFISRASERTLDDIVSIAHDYFRDMVSYDGNIASWDLVATTLDDVVKDGKPVKAIQSGGANLAFTEASVLQNLLARQLVLQGNSLSAAIEKSKSHIILVVTNGYGGDAERNHALIGFVIPSADSRRTKVRLIDPLKDDPGQVMPYRALLNPDEYALIITQEGATAIGNESWGSFTIR